MSLVAMTSVKAVKGISPTARLVLFVLAEYAGADGLCHPSQQTVAEDAGLSERAVRKAMKELRDEGVIASDRRVRRNGSRTSDQISLLYFKAKEEVEEGARLARKRSPEAEGNRHDVPVHIEGDNRHDMPDANRHETSDLPARGAGLTTFEPASEPEQEAYASRSDASACATARRVWAEKAPERVSPVQVKRAWGEALERSGLTDDQLLGAVRAAVARDPDFGRDRAVGLARWLDEDRWEAWLSAPAAVVGSGSAWSGPAEVRAVVERSMGTKAVASYLDPATWDEGLGAIIAATKMAADRLRDGAGRALKALGVTVMTRGAAHG